MHLGSAIIHDVQTGARVIYALLEMLDEAVAANDRVALISVMDFLADALHAVGRGLDVDSQLLGARRKPRRPSWQDMGPEQILDDLRTMVSVEHALIEARQERIPQVRHATAKRLAAEIKSILQKLRAATLERKGYLVKQWPDYLTEAIEKEFGEWL